MLQRIAKAEVNAWEESQCQSSNSKYERTVGGSPNQALPRQRPNREHTNPPPQSIPPLSKPHRQPSSQARHQAALKSATNGSKA